MVLCTSLWQAKELEDTKTTLTDVAKYIEEKQGSDPM